MNHVGGVVRKIVSATSDVDVDFVHIEVECKENLYCDWQDLLGGGATS